MSARTAIAAAAVTLTLAATGCAHENSAPRRMTFHLAAATAGPVSANVPAKPVATVASSTDGMDFELYDVRRSNGVVRVVFALHNVGDADVNLGDATQDLDENPTVSVHDASGVALVDGTGLKEYKTFLEGGDGSACLCSQTWNAIGDTRLGPGTSRYYVAEVAAPPASVQQVTVRAGVATVTGVRIEG